MSAKDCECLRPDGSVMLIRVARPAGDGPFPAVIGIHGGGWWMGDRNSNALLDDMLAAHGIVAAAPEFRMPPDAKFPVSLSDVHLAIRWLKANAPKLKVKLDWIGGIGLSSGAHQLLTVILQERDPRYAAMALPDGPVIDAALAYVVVFYPVADPLARFRMAQKTGNKNLLEAHAKFWSSEQEMADARPRSVYSSTGNSRSRRRCSCFREPTIKTFPQTWRATWSMLGGKLAVARP